MRLWVYNPLSRNYKDKVMEHAQILETEPDRVPYGIFPASPGLLAWGSDDNGNECYFLTKGSPTKWPIVLRSEDGACEQFSGPLTTFLSKVFTRELSTKTWPEPFFAGEESLRFETEILPEVEEPEPLTIYDVYRLNGNKAGFWVHDVRDPPDIHFFIKQIANRSEGDIEWTSGGTSGPPVFAERYWNKATLLHQFEALPTAIQPVFVRASEPN